MSEKLNLEKIKKLPREEFKEILKSWVEEKEIRKSLQKKLRQQLISDFTKTEIAQRLQSERQQGVFKSRDYVIDAVQAENLYVNNNHFTLSVFFTETKHASILPNFEKDRKFRYRKKDVRELIELLGITKTDPITNKILYAYESSSSQSLLSIILKELVDSHVCKSSVETRNVALQTEMEINQIDEKHSSIISASAKAKITRTSHPLLNEYGNNSKSLKRQSKKPKDVTMIASILGEMSGSITEISEKLDNFKETPLSVDSQAIVGCVGTIMNQLNSCINNFESLCKDIKVVNDPKKEEKKFENWMEDLQSSENGKRLVKKLQRTFSKVVEDEKTKIKHDYHKKLEREKTKLTKYYNRTRKSDEIDIKELSTKITKEINEIYENTCLKMRSIDEEENLLLKSLGKDNRVAVTVEKMKIPEKASSKINLDDCRQIHSESDSDESKQGSSIKSTEGYTSSSSSTTFTK